MQGPQNDENINGTHPAMCAALHTNSDVQLPYRLPVCLQYHSDYCVEDCLDKFEMQTVLEAAQNSQDAQVGYSCDYQNKRAARACNEVRECIKGHRKLHTEVSEKSVPYIGHRHVTRLCSDAYGKGVVRSNQESVNLRAYGTTRDVLAAETFRTTATLVFSWQRLERLARGLVQQRSR